MIYGTFKASDVVVPAQAGIQSASGTKTWIPAFAGMTNKSEVGRGLYSEWGPGVRNTEWITWLYSKYTM
jgi:hypothetical protein